MASMKQCRGARQHRLTSRTKVKRPGNPRYRGMGDGNKGKKKKMWYEVICGACFSRIKTEYGVKPKCNKCGAKHGSQEQ